VFRGPERARGDRAMRSLNKVLWVVQVVLALTFLFAGGMKLVLPAAALAQGPVPSAFLRFIGVAEVAGALGLLLPGLLPLPPGLTPPAAAGLVLIMIGATTITIPTSGIGPAPSSF